MNPFRFVNGAMIVALFLVVLSGEISDAAAEPAGVAQCQRYQRNTSCRLRWKFPGNGRMTCTIQEWDRSSAVWRSISDSSYYGAAGYRLEPVSPGHLYRVVGCPASGSSCISSNVVWAPVWESTTEIPETVEFEIRGSPVVFGVTKATVHGDLLPWRNVVTQYNMYLVLREASAFFRSDAEMPPMPEPSMKGEAPDSVEEMVAFNVQQDYEQMRSDVLSLRRSPTPGPR